MTTKYFAVTFAAIPKQRRMLCLLLSLFLIPFLLSRTTLAQSVKDNWDEVMKLKSGSKLSVKTKTGQKFGGKVTTVTDDSITISASKTSVRDVELKRQDIAEIRKKSGGRTAGYAAMIGGLGMAGGYGIGYGIGDATNARFRPEYPTMAVGAAVGAVVGAIIGSRGEVIYKAP